MNKNYGLTNKPNHEIKDEAPNWMNDFFKDMLKEKKEEKKEHPFAGIDDPILNPKRIGLDKK